MTKKLANHPGMWLRDDAAAAFDAFEAKYGRQTVNRAGATVAEQQHAINRWDQGGTYNRPPYLYPPARPASASLHVKDGGTAVDLARAGDLKEEMAEFGFSWYGKSDPVHYWYTGWAGNPASNPGSAIGATTRLKGKAWVMAVQEKYRRMGHDLGPAGVDGIDGPRFVEITRWEQAHAGPNGNPGGALITDGIAGDKTNAYLDWWLNRTPAAPAVTGVYADIQRALNKFGYNLAVDNQWGPRSSDALADFQRRHGLVVDRKVGPKTRAALGI